MNLQEIVPLSMHADLKLLSRVGTWFRVEQGDSVTDGRPHTNLRVDTAKLDASAFAATHLRRNLHKIGYLGMYYMEALATAIKDGPKLFIPTAEQFEAMEHVETHLPVGDFRSPFPMLFIRIPSTRRLALASQCGLDPQRVPHYVSVRDRCEPGDFARSVLVSHRFYDGEEQHQFFTDQPGNKDLEDAFCRRVFRPGMHADVMENAKFDFSETVCRASLNLCLMLTHYGNRIGPPAEPAEYAKHRTKKHLSHLATGDFLTVQMTQNIRVRDVAGPRNYDEGTGGYELKPHWRKGHWRAHRGFGAARAAGQMVPLSFIRPCLVRPDRAVGDLSESNVTYVGGR